MYVKLLFNGGTNVGHVRQPLYTIYQQPVYIYFLVCYYLHVYAHSGLQTRIACTNYEVVRLFQPVFQPHTVAKPALEFGCATLILYSQRRSSIQITRDELYRNKYNIQWAKDRQVGHQLINQWDFSWLNCVTRDLVLPWHNPIRIYHDLKVWESDTKPGPTTYIFPFRKFNSISKVQVWIGGPIMKDTEISDQTLSPCWGDTTCIFFI